MLDEGPEANHQCFSWGQVFFQPHPGVWPVVQIAAVGGSSGGGRQCSSTVYLGSLRLENRPHHGTDHDSKSLPSSSRVCLPARSLRSRPAKHRSRRPAAGELVSSLFRVSSAGTEQMAAEAKVTMRRSYGFRTFRILELALYHSLGKLPEPECTHEFF